MLKGFKGFRGLEGFRGLDGKLGRPEEAIDVALGCLLAANAWRTARWTAQKKRWIWPSGSYCLRWTPIRSH